MIKSTEEYKAAIVGSPRRIEVLAVVDISDPDMVFGEVKMDSIAPWSKPEELHDKSFDAPVRYSTFEPNRWLLDGNTKVFPDDYVVQDNVGVANDVLSGPDGRFPDNNPAFVTQEFENVGLLQYASIFFSSEPADGVPADFDVDIMSGGVSYYKKEFIGNTQSQISLSGFTVYNPDSIKITVKRWSLPGRRARAVEIIPGVYEQWSSGILASFDCMMYGDFSCLSLPYGTLSISMDNKSRRFEPRRKDGVFQSIEARQGIDVYIGVRLPSGSVGRKKIGVFYQSGDGWKTSDNSVTMTWNLVDIVGLVANRTYIVPDVLPTDLDGWISSVVLQLGSNFKNKYHVDPSYASKPVVANSKDDVTGKKCGDILRWACMATGTWPRADQETGYLTAEPLWNEGNKITLGNMVSYPTMSANQSVAAIIFTLADENGTQYVVSGNSTSSEETVSVSNPFIHTEEDALAAARNILSCYGGNVIDIVGRGDPSSEIGDVDTIWLDESNATVARRKSQNFNIVNGLLQNCQSTLIQADGSHMFQEFEIITTSGKWKAPANVKGNQLRVAIGSGGQGSSPGEDGYVGIGMHNSVESGYGEAGQDGSGARVWHGTININPEQEFDVSIGEGGNPSETHEDPGEYGGDTTFGAYSSADGELYQYGYTDIVSGQSFARSGVAKPVDGTGDGGAGGSGGEPGAGRLYQEPGDIGYRFEKLKEPGKGKPGVKGASGFVIVAWDKEDVGVG